MVKIFSEIPRCPEDSTDFNVRVRRAFDILRNLDVTLGSLSLLSPPVMMEGIPSADDFTPGIPGQTGSPGLIGPPGVQWFAGESDADAYPSPPGPIGAIGPIGPIGVPSIISNEDNSSEPIWIGQPTPMLPLTATVVQDADYIQIIVGGLPYQVTYANLTHNLGSGANGVRIGPSAGAANTSGNNNVCIGAFAGKNITSSSDNTFIGSFCGFTCDGINNTAVGTGSAFSLQDGFGNTVVGHSALSQITTGSACTAIGSEALTANTADYMTAVGYNALAANTSGINSTAVGFSSLAACTGDSNTGLGYNAGYQISSGTNNIAIGVSAAGSLTTGSHNTVIGDAVLATAAAYRTVLGIGATDNGDNTVTLGRATDIVWMPGGANIGDGKDVVLGTTTGTKFGTATNQKIGFYGATPVVQGTTASAAPAGGTGTAAGGWDTAANRDTAITLINQMRTVLRNAGLMA